MPKKKQTEEALLRRSNHMSVTAASCFTGNLMNLLSSVSLPEREKEIVGCQMDAISLISLITCSHGSNVGAGARHPSLRSPYIGGFPPSPQSYTLSLQQVLSPPVCTSQHAQHAIILLILWPIQPSYTL